MFEMAQDGGPLAMRGTLVPSLGPRGASASDSSMSPSPVQGAGAVSTAAPSSSQWQKGAYPSGNECSEASEPELDVPSRSVEKVGPGAASSIEEACDVDSFPLCPKEETNDVIEAGDDLLDLLSCDSSCSPEDSLDLF